MAQNDLNIANQSFPSFRTDLNNALSAIQTTHSGTSRPTGAVAGQIWLDTTSATTPTLKYYDGADDISLATLDHSANTVNWLDSTVSVTGLSTTATGTVLTLTDSVTTSTVNLILDNQKEIRFRETTANGTNYVALKAPASLSADATFTLPATDGTSGQVLQTNGSGVLSFSTISAGITEADSFRQEPDTSFSGSGASDVTSGWERVDTDGFDKIGTGLTQSSGIFTFPSTGYYLINFSGVFSSGVVNYTGLFLDVTLDNSTYSSASAGYVSTYSGGVAYASNSNSFIIKVTDTANIKFKFSVNRSDTVTLVGSTASSFSGFTCIKLAGV